MPVALAVRGCTYPPRIGSALPISRPIFQFVPSGQEGGQLLQGREQQHFDKLDTNQGNDR